MIIKSLYDFFLAVVIFTSGVGFESEYTQLFDNGGQKQESEILVLEGSITGDAEVCVGETPEPEITFTGVDNNNGGRPYRFEYTINGGASQFITTGNNSSSVSLAHPTSVAGTFVYDFSVTYLSRCRNCYTDRKRKR